MKDAVLVESYTFRLQMAAQRMEKYTNHDYERNGVGITMNEGILLKLLSEKGNMSQGDLTKLSFRDESMVNNLLEALEQKALVARADNDRSQVLLTEKGAAKVEETKPIIHNLRAKGLKDFSEEEVDTLNRLLDKIIDQYDF